MSDLVLLFPGTAQAPLELVGGKGHSLLRLSAAGLAVPPGVVLTSAFFASWLEPLLASAEWLELPQAPPARWPSLCASLKQQAASFPCTPRQQQALDALGSQLATLTASRRFAVRSSSPQEDVPGASFAGGYVTHLGVSPEDLAGAIRSCFASLFDERVIAYKTARGLDLAAPRMAVVVQEQIESEVAGVAFSLNPLSNDFDQAVIDASWGQGETVVSGQVTPDHWVIDKRTGEIRGEVIGDKRLSRWLQPDGQLAERQDFRRREACLTANQLQRLLALVRRVESALQCPIDLEWAIANDTIHLLQARPVTAFVPLPAELVTEPGRRRRLYMDLALSSGLTINAPISPLGLAVFRRLFTGLARLAFGGSIERELASGDALIVFAGSRMYLDLSATFWLSSPRRMAEKMALTDTMLARALAAIDPREYQALQRPTWARLRLLRLLPVAFWRMRRMLGNCFLPFLAPRRTHRRMAQQLAAFEQELDHPADLTLPLAAFWERYVTTQLRTLFDVSLAGVGPGVLAGQAFTALAERLTRDDAALRSQLDRGFEGNVVVAMSLEMHRLARLLPSAQRHDPAQLAKRLETAELSAAFSDGWNGFLRQFGARGPLEMDVAQPRYADAPRLALQQIAAMTVDDPAYDPAASARQLVEQRRAAVATVVARAGPVRRWILRRLSLVIDLFAGFRDTPKHHLLKTLHALRQRLVREGERLHREGRLDAPEHVFDLEFDELLAAPTDDGLDLRSRAGGRRQQRAELRQLVVNFPPLIDSRGRILRPPPGVRRAGEFSGVGLSPGVVTGRARTLRSPHEKPLSKGEVLIAYTTDPGWTPIFANAAAVVLEIGGALQHGAVVARELGLPCVAGIEGITTSLPDGQWIEVDGSAGTIRLQPAPATSQNRSPPPLDPGFTA